MTFATVGEGATDHALLQNILLGFCKEQQLESGDISPVQPRVDETGKQIAGEQGGWKGVLKWLEEKQYHDAFQFNDYIVVEIDTDVCEEPGFDIPKAINGAARSAADLVFAVRQKLEQIIGDADLQFYAGRFHFAVAVHTLECWLLPIWGSPQEVSRIHTCKQRVDNGLSRANKPGLRKDDVDSYLTASRDLRKRNKLLEAAESQVSLGLFLQSLAPVCPG